MPPCAVCRVDAKNVCSKCHKVTYCGVACQTKDWKAHKKQCDKPHPSTDSPRFATADMNVPYPASFSPFGHTFNIYTGKYTPVSHKAIFFSEMLGYDVNDPEQVYAELVDTFRLRRFDDASAGRPVNPAPAAFMDFLGKVKNAAMLPSWWNEGVHEPGLLKFVEADEWGRLDRILNAQEIFAHYNDATRRPEGAERRLRMMEERIWGFN